MSSAGKTKQTQTVNYTTVAAPSSPGDAALDAEYAKGAASDPGIPYRAANQKASLRNRLSAITSPDYSPETEAAVRYQGEHQIDQETGQAYQQDAYNRRESQWNKAYAIAQARRGQVVSSGGTTTQSGGFWSSLGAGLLTAAI